MKLAYQEIWLRKVYFTYQQAHDKTYNKTCVTSKTQTSLYIHPLVLVYSSLNSMEAVEGTCNQRRLIRVNGVFADRMSAM